MSNNTPVPVAELKAQYQAYREEIDTVVAEVLESGWYILGERCKTFERDFSAFIGTRHTIGVANGTDAISIALRALGVGPGDEVITVSHSAVATVAAIELTGAVPVCADIDPIRRCLSPEAFERAITPKTRAVVPVHIYGQPADMEAIASIAQRRGIAVLEDCAQAHGAAIGSREVGTFGDIAAFSFYPTKNLGALGDGGGIVTASDELAEKVQLLRQYGWKERYISLISGTNSRLDELQAAILSVKLKYLERDNQRRREIAARYTAALEGSDVAAPSGVPGTVHAMHLYVVECDRRDALQSFLKERGVSSALHYPQAIHQQPAYREKIRGWNTLPVTERIYTRILTLPLFPELTDDQVSRVTEALTSWRVRG